MQRLQVRRALGDFGDERARRGVVQRHDRQPLDIPLAQPQRVQRREPILREQRQRHTIDRAVLDDRFQDRCAGVHGTEGRELREGGGGEDKGGSSLESSKTQFTQVVLRLEEVGELLVTSEGESEAA